MYRILPGRTRVSFRIRLNHCFIRSYFRVNQNVNSPSPNHIIYTNITITNQAKTNFFLSSHRIANQAKTNFFLSSHRITNQAESNFYYKSGKSGCLPKVGSKLCLCSKSGGRKDNCNVDFEPPKFPRKRSATGGFQILGFPGK